jgi:hypothetical protein
MSLWSSLIDRIKFAQTAQKVFRSSGTLAISETICKRAFKCTEVLAEDLKRSFPQPTPDYLHKRLQVFLELLCFFTHIASRVVSRKFGAGKRQQLNNKIGPLLVEFTVKYFYESQPSESASEIASEIKQLFLDRVNTSEREYSSCEAFLLKPEDDVAYADKVAAGLKSKGTLNLLTDNIVSILDEQNPITYLRIMHILISTFDLKEFEATVIQAAKQA